MALFISHVSKCLGTYTKSHLHFWAGKTSCNSHQRELPHWGYSSFHFWCRKNYHKHNPCHCISLLPLGLPSHTRGKGKPWWRELVCKSEMKQHCQLCKRSQTSRRNPVRVFLLSSALHKPEELFQLILRKVFGSSSLTGFWGIDSSNKRNAPADRKDAKGKWTTAPAQQRTHTAWKKGFDRAEAPTGVPPRLADLFKNIPYSCGAALFAFWFPWALSLPSHAASGAMPG